MLASREVQRMTGENESLAATRLPPVKQSPRVTQAMRSWKLKDRLKAMQRQEQDLTNQLMVLKKKSFPLLPPIPPTK